MLTVPLAVFAYGSQTRWLPMRIRDKAALAALLKDSLLIS